MSNPETERPRCLACSICVYLRANRRLPASFANVVDLLASSSPNPEHVDENEPFIESSSSKQLSPNEKSSSSSTECSCQPFKVCSTRRRRYFAAIAFVVFLLIVLGTSYTNSHTNSQSTASSATSINKIFEEPLTTGYIRVDDSQADKKPAGHAEDEAATSSTTRGQPLPSDSVEDSDDYFVDHDDHPEDPAASSMPSTIVTRPAAPDLVSRPPPEHERFLAYLPHSGYHNQRIALANAILLGNLLNRTVLMPYARLGKPVGWKEKSMLQRVLEKEQKTPDLIERCTSALADQDATPEGCEDYKAYSRAVQLSHCLEYPCLSPCPCCRV